MAGGRAKRSSSRSTLKRRGSDPNIRAQEKSRPRANMKALQQLDRTILVPAIAQVLTVGAMLFYIVALATDSWQTTENVTVGLWRVCAIDGGEWGSEARTYPQILKYLKCYKYDEQCQVDLTPLKITLNTRITNTTTTNSTTTNSTTTTTFEDEYFMYPQGCQSIKTTRGLVFIAFLVGFVAVLMDILSTRRCFGSWKIAIFLASLGFVTGTCS